MRVPLALHIRIGLESLKTRKYVDQLAEAREFELFSIESREELMVIVREVNLGDERMVGLLAGYLLGLETARAMLILDPVATGAGVTL